METFEFSIIASGLDPEAEDFETRFFEAGCDDATISLQKGHIILDFAREASSFDDAIRSAIADVERAGAIVDHVEPDTLVNLSDIAARVGVTRAAVSNYARGDRGEAFPAPVRRVTTDAALYDWVEVAAWFQHRGAVTEQVYQNAVIVREVNTDLDHQHRERQLAAEKAQDRRQMG